MARVKKYIENWVTYDLWEDISSKADDNAVVKLSGNQTINWTKTYTTSPVVPSKTSAAANTATAIATEAQVYLKQDKLTAGTWIDITNNVISNTQTSAEWWNITGTLWNQTDLSNALAAKVWSSNNTINNVVHLSQSEYDNLGTKDPNTWYSTPDDASGGFDPENTWSTGQLLTRTATWYDWETVTGVPSGWATGQVLTKTSNWPAWATVQWEIVYITQDDYDLLPSSKLTDGKNYFIIDEYPS